MNIYKISQPQIDEVSIFTNKEELPKLAKNGIFERSANFIKHPNHADLQGVLMETRIDGFSIDYAQFKHQKTFTSQAIKEDDHLEIHFELIGSKSYKEQKKTIEIDPGRYSFFYLPQLNGTLSFKPQNETRESIGVEFSIQYIKELLGEDLSVLGGLEQNIQAKNSYVHTDNAPTSTQMRCILESILRCNLNGVLKKVYIESKVNELLIQVLQQDKRFHCISTELLSRADIDKIYYTKEIVDKTLDNPYSLKELSRVVGLNEFKLKKGFKEVFDTTIFQYILDERMRLSKELLLSKERNIAEIALHVGYKNPTHFTAAFKKYFGYLPSNYRSKFL